ncbi:MAG: hypothetical protein C5B52_14670 [Bacteroidetes bacterium]|nr:MAG: hypothetical protein C5B52_14670 [Bacteroidota bacterium]
MTLSFSKISLATILILSLFSSIASAHVTVIPKTSTPGAWETYTVKVPVEKESATTKLTLKIPAGVEFEQYQPVPGWNVTLQKDANGKVTSITFETTGEGILPGQFQSFSFVAKNPGQAGKAAWDAYQYYKDGSVVEWTGDESSKSPHSITDIVKATANQMPGMNMQSAKETPKTATTTAATNNSLPLILSIVAVLLSLVGIGLAFRKR